MAGMERVRQLLRNPISMAGLALSAVALGNIAFFFFVDLTNPHPSPYVGILAYMVAPGFFVLGLAVALLGAIYFHRRKAVAAGKESRYLRLDFSDPSQRGAVGFFHLRDRVCAAEHGGQLPRIR